MPLKRKWTRVVARLASISCIFTPSRATKLGPSSRMHYSVMLPALPRKAAHLATDLARQQAIHTSKDAGNMSRSEASFLLIIASSCLPHIQTCYSAKNAGVLQKTLALVRTTFTIPRQSQPSFDLKEMCSE